MLRSRPRGGASLKESLIEKCSAHSEEQIMNLSIPTMKVYRERPDMRTQSSEKRWGITSAGVYEWIGLGKMTKCRHTPSDIETFAKVFMERVPAEDTYPL